MNLTVIVDQGVILLLGLKSSQGMGFVKNFVPCFDTPVNKVVAAPKIESVVSEGHKGSSAWSFLLMCFKA